MFNKKYLPKWKKFFTFVARKWNSYDFFKDGDRLGKDFRRWQNALERRVFFHRDVERISSGMWMNFPHDGNKITSGMEKTTNHVEGMTQTKPRFKSHDTRVWKVWKPGYEWNVLFVVIVATPVGWDRQNNDRRNGERRNRGMRTTYGENVECKPPLVKTRHRHVSHPVECEPRWNYRVGLAK